MGRPSRFSPEVRERAVRMVEEHREAHASEWAVLQSVAPKLGCTAETLRKWVRQAQRDAGHRPAPGDEIASLEQQNGIRARLRASKGNYARSRIVLMWPHMDDKTSFQISYDGPALESGRMDVRDLAPALLAVGELCQASNHVLNGDRAKVAVNVSSEFQRGSFQVDLEVAQTIAKAAKDTLLSREVATGLTLAAVLGLVKGAQVSLIALYKLLKGKKPKNTTTLRSGDIRIEFEDGKTVEVGRDVVKLYNDSTVREHAKNVVRPLERDGIQVV